MMVVQTGSSTADWIVGYVGLGTEQVAAQVAAAWKVSAAAMSSAVLLCGVFMRVFLLLMVFWLRHRPRYCGVAVWARSN